MMNNFEEDKNFGEEAQRRFAKTLVSKGFIIDFMAEGDFPDWDIKLTNGKTFEIKTDRRALDTGNLFIETSYKGEYSGLAKTKADYFVIIVGNFALVAKTEDVMRFLLSHPLISKPIYGVGDDGNSTGFLIKEFFFKPKNLQTFELV